MEQDIQGEDQTREHMGLAPTSMQLKRSNVQEDSATRKNPKVSKTKDAMEELMLEQTTVLGVLIAQLQALQVQSPGMITPHVVEGASEAEPILHARTTNTLVLPEGTIVAVADDDMRGWGLTLATLPRETLYQL